LTGFATPGSGAGPAIVTRASPAPANPGISKDRPPPGSPNSPLQRRENDEHSDLMLAMIIALDPSRARDLDARRLRVLMRERPNAVRRDIRQPRRPLRRLRLAVRLAHHVLPERFESIGELVYELLAVRVF
jgi:hypothetical protein